MTRPRTRSLPALLAIPLLAIASRAAAQDVPTITVQYPPEGATLTASDSTFVFGRVEAADPGAVRLTVDGAPVEVHPGGGWLAFVPIEPGSFTFRVEAGAGGSRTAAVERRVVVPRPPGDPGDPELGYKPETVEPSEPIATYAGDTLRAAVVAAPGQRVVARIGERSVPLVPEAEPVVANRGRQVFGAASPVDGGPAAHTGERWVRYAGDVFLTYGGGGRDSLFVELDGAGLPRRSVLATTVDVLDPTVVRVAVLDDDRDGSGRTDGKVVARAGPGLGYDLLVPNGTVAPLRRRVGDQVEIALATGKTAWVAASEAYPIPGPRPRSAVAVLRVRDAGDWSEVVVPLEARLPFGVEQRLDPVGYSVEVYGATSNTDWIRSTFGDPLVESVRWSQPEDDVYAVEIDLAGDRAWGYRARWEGTHLVLGFRRPPAALADRRFRSALHGVRIVVDAGHGPDPGSIGPTGYEEREANLAIARRLAEILDRRGAEVVMTRVEPDTTLGLYDRTALAARERGDLFVSVHNNALPDGVNPFENNGTSTFYYHPQSEALAEAIQAALLPRTRLADYGVGYGNLAVLRMTEMPSVLVESAFMMIPEQEAALRTPEYQERIAEGIAAGLESYLAAAARGR